MQRPSENPRYRYSWHYHNPAYEFTIAGNPVNYSGNLKDLAMPVLVITGDDDRIVPTARSIQLSREIPGSELVVLNDCGHVPQEECPDQFMTAVKAFLERAK